MNRVINILIILITSTCVYAGNSGVIVTKKEQIELLVNDPKSTEEKKLENLVLLLMHRELVDDKISNNQIISIGEKLLFSESKNNIVTINQLSIIGQIIDGRINPWPLKINPDQALGFIEKIGRKRNDLYGAQHLFLYGYYSKKGDLKKSKMELSLLLNAIRDAPEEFKRPFAFMLDSLDFLGHYGSLDIAYLYPRYKKQVDYVLKTIDDFSSNKDFIKLTPNLGIYIELCNFLGDPELGIVVGKKILTAIEGLDDNYEAKRGNVYIYKYMSESYRLLNDYEQSNKYDDLYIKTNIDIGNFDVVTISKLLGMSFASNNAATVDYLIKKLNDTNSVYWKESDRVWKQRLVDSYKTIKVSQITDKDAFAKVLAPLYFERLFMDVGVLDYLGSAHAAYLAYKMLNDYDKSALIAKLYINKFIELRKAVSGSKDYVALLTSTQSDILKDFVGTFYEAGDVDSALKTLQLLKEVSYDVYSRAIDSSLSDFKKLDLSGYQNLYLKKIKTITSEIYALNSNNKLTAADKNSAILARLDSIRDLNTTFSTNVKLDFSPDKRLISISNQNNKKVNIEYLIGKDEVIAFVSTYRNTTKFSKKVSRLELRKLVQDILSAIRSRKDYSSDLNKLSVILSIQDIISTFDTDVNTLIFRTDDVLGSFPVSILIGNGSYLINSYNVNILPLENNANDIKNSNISVFGASKQASNYPALPFVTQEVDFIDRISSKIKHQLFLDSAFSKASFINSNLKVTNIVHVASHFSPYNSSKGYGELILGDGSSLTTYDLHSLLPNLSNLNLVTLSACDTAVQLVFNTSTYYEGLTNLFSKKGAKHVIGTLWQVNDKSSSDFMRLFYFL
jgi:CHAT domain-containing protein